VIDTQETYSSQICVVFVSETSAIRVCGQDPGMCAT